LLFERFRFETVDDSGTELVVDSNGDTLATRR
jgi:hypothetical protein